MKRVKASFTVEASVITSASILVIAAVIMFGINLRGRVTDMCESQFLDEVRCVDVMNGREADLSRTYDRAPEILYKYRFIEKVIE